MNMTEAAIVAHDQAIVASAHQLVTDWRAGGGNPDVLEALIASAMAGLPRSGDGAQSGEGFYEQQVADAYQIVGSLADQFGVHDHPEVVRALDYLAYGKTEDSSPILPWPRQKLAPPPASDASPAEGREDALLHRVMDQAEADLRAAHAEICKLQNLDPSMHSWPEWSSPANTLRWFDKIRQANPADSAPAPMAGGETGEALLRELSLLATDMWFAGYEKDATQIRGIMDRLQSALTAERQQRVEAVKRTELLEATLEVAYKAMKAAIKFGQAEVSSVLEETPEASKKRLALFGTLDMPLAIVGGIVRRSDKALATLSRSAP